MKSSQVGEKQINIKMTHASVVQMRNSRSGSSLVISIPESPQPIKYVTSWWQLPGHIKHHHQPTCNHQPSYALNKKRKSEVVSLAK